MKRRITFGNSMYLAKADEVVNRRKVLQISNFSYMQTVVIFLIHYQNIAVSNQHLHLTT